jgi:uncharacterized DUF497 family protein
MTRQIAWDPDKNAINIRRHGIAFEDAGRIFDGSTLERVDDRFDYGEIRIYAIGLVDGVEVTAIYADRGDDAYWLIAAWRAEPHERRRYWQSLPQGWIDELETRARQDRRRGASRAGRRPRRVPDE